MNALTSVSAPEIGFIQSAYILPTFCIHSGDIQDARMKSHAGFRQKIKQTCMRLYAHILDDCRMSAQWVPIELYQFHSAFSKP